MLLLPPFMVHVVQMGLSWLQLKKVKLVELLLIMMARLVLVSWIHSMTDCMNSGQLFDCNRQLMLLREHIQVLMVMLLILVLMVTYPDL